MELLLLYMEFRWFWSRTGLRVGVLNYLVTCWDFLFFFFFLYYLVLALALAFAFLLHLVIAFVGIVFLGYDICEVRQAGGRRVGDEQQNWLKLYDITLLSL